MKAKIVVVGSLNMDLVVGAPHIPRPGETLLGSDFDTVPGGKGANQAVAAARLGAQVHMVGCVGDDAYGETQRQGLEAEGINTSTIQTAAGAHTGVALITVADSGENTIVVSSGANWELNADDIAAAEAVIAAADMVLLQLEVPPAVVEAAAATAHAHNVPVLLNPAPARELPAALLRQITYLIPNESEAALLSGQDVDNLGGVDEAAHALRRQGPEAVVVTLGARGAYLSTAEETEHLAAFPVDVRDTTAAGDAFVAAFAVAVASGRRLPEAVRFANVAGALAATRPGAQPSLPTLNDVLNYLSQPS